MLLAPRFQPDLIVFFYIIAHFVLTDILIAFIPSHTHILLLYDNFHLITIIITILIIIIVSPAGFGYPMVQNLRPSQHLGHLFRH